MLLETPYSIQHELMYIYLSNLPSSFIQCASPARGGTASRSRTSNPYVAWSRVPLICEASCYAQIPSCKPSDFLNGCSVVCELVLEAVAQSVIHACSHALAPPNSLLGAILEGQIIQDICPPKSTSPQQLRPVHSRSLDVATIPIASLEMQISKIGSTTKLQPPNSTCATTKESLLQPTTDLTGVTRVSICAAASIPPVSPKPIASTDSPCTATRTSAMNKVSDANSVSTGALMGSYTDVGSIALPLRRRSLVSLIAVIFACIQLQ